MRLQTTIWSVWLVATPGFGAAGAEADLAKRTESITVEVDSSVPVIKSDTVGGTDFGRYVRAEVSAHAGTNKALGIAARYDRSQARFSQVDADTDVEWTEVRLMYRYWLVYPEVVAGSVSLKTKEADQDIMDAVGITRGVGLMLRVPTGADAVFRLEMLYSAAVRTVDAKGRDIGIGARMDVDIGGSTSLFWPQLRFNAGYLYRTYDIDVDGQAERQFESGPYIGLNLGFSP